jgi:hypothetical protein
MIESDLGRLNGREAVPILLPRAEPLGRYRRATGFDYSSIMNLSGFGILFITVNVMANKYLPQIPKSTFRTRIR